MSDEKLNAMGASCFVLVWDHVFVRSGRYAQSNLATARQECGSAFVEMSSRILVGVMGFAFDFTFQFVKTSVHLGEFRGRPSIDIGFILNLQIARPPVGGTCIMASRNARTAQARL